ncbi:MAG: glycosyltransferase [Candidatus Thiodiazotropha sp.]
MKYSISFVVPAFNESKYIELCVKSINKQCDSAELNYEIIVVDNGSTDKTATLANDAGATVYSIKRAAVSHARNFGVSKSRYPLIAFIDGDVEITREWVDTLKHHYNDLISKPLFITGHQCVVPESGGWIEQYWFKNLKDQFLGGANIITSRKAFDDIGGFNELLKTGEDYDFCIRCISEGYNYFTDKGFVAIHLGFPHTFVDFLRREYWHGEGDFKSIQVFFSSIVAIISVIFLLLIILSVIFLATGHTLIAIICLAILLLLNIAITLKRFGSCGIKTIVVNTFLNFSYFFARIASLYRAIKNRKYNY